MQEIAKILIAYDGAVCSDAALNDLRRAGLPAAAEVVVMTVADVVLPPPDGAVAGDALCPARVLAGLRHAQARAEQAVQEARAVAKHAAQRVKAAFPGWHVTAQACGDAPAWAVIKMADRYAPGLIIVGSHRHSVVGGHLIGGSVSQRVLYEARCSVRVARCSEVWRHGPLRIVIGVHGSPDAALAVDAVAARAWPEGSVARLVTARAAVPPEMLVATLRAAGLATVHVSRAGKPAHVLLEEAATWEADAIFVGTQDIHGWHHFLHGSVSAVVAARAPCSVEVVRPERGAAPAHRGWGRGAPPSAGGA